MKQNATYSHKEVAHKADQEYPVMSMLSAALNAQIGKIEKQYVRSSTDYLGSVGCGIVVLFQESTLVWVYIYIY